MSEPCCITNNAVSVYLISCDAFISTHINDIATTSIAASRKYGTSPTSIMHTCCIILSLNIFQLNTICSSESADWILADHV